MNEEDDFIAGKGPLAERLFALPREEATADLFAHVAAHADTVTRTSRQTLAARVRNRWKNLSSPVVLTVFASCVTLVLGVSLWWQTSLPRPAVLSSSVEPRQSARPAPVVSAPMAEPVAAPGAPAADVLHKQERAVAAAAPPPGGVLELSDTLASAAMVSALDLSRYACPRHLLVEAAEPARAEQVASGLRRLAQAECLAEVRVKTDRATPHGRVRVRVW